MALTPSELETIEKLHQRHLLHQPQDDLYYRYYRLKQRAEAAASEPRSR